MLHRKSSPSISIKATKEQAFSVVTDYDSYAEWTADCIHSQVLFKEHDVVVAEFVSPELMDGKYVLEFVHTAPTSVIYTQIDQYRSKGLSGSWEIMESSDGQGVIISGTMRLRTSPWKKFANRKKTDMIIHSRLEAVKDQVSYVYSSKDDTKAGERTEGIDRKKIAEVVQRGENLEIWFLGEKYELRKIPEDDE